MQANLVRRLVVTDRAERVIGIISLDDLNALPPNRAPLVLEAD